MPRGHSSCHHMTSRLFDGFRKIVLELQDVASCYYTPASIAACAAEKTQQVSSSIRHRALDVGLLRLRQCYHAYCQAHSSISLRCTPHVSYTILLQAPGQSARELCTRPPVSGRTVLQAEAVIPGWQRSYIIGSSTAKEGEANENAEGRVEAEGQSHSAQPEVSSPALSTSKQQNYPYTSLMYQS